MALNFGLLDPNAPAAIANSVTQGRQDVMREQMAQQQLKTGALQQESTQLDLEKVKREAAGLQRMQQLFMENGKSPDMRANFAEMVKSGVPHFMDIGYNGLRALEEQDRYQQRYGGGAPNAMAAPAQDVNNLTAPAAPSAQAPVNAMTAPAPANAMAAPAAAPANAMAAPNRTAQIQQEMADLSAYPNVPAAKARLKVLEKELESAFKPHVVANNLVGPSGNVIFTADKTAPDAALMQQLGYPLTQAGYTAFKDAQRQERMLTAAEEAQKIRIANASRPPVQPVAPTITTIVDPTNPNQMISIDAKRYQGGGAGSVGVIGVAGKEPSAALRVNKVEQGKTQLADDLDNLRSAFQTLDQMRAIPSTERNVLSNLGSATAASGVGQMLGRATGTEAQVERDVINSARMRLVNSIKNATGMSAQQLNSNVELQTMLKSISDPGQSVEAAMRIIDDIDNAYVKNNNALPKRNKPAVAAPNIDALLNKYK
jgi:hypothetical protein